MATQAALDEAYIGCAFAIAKLSHARRRKVGVILVASGGGIIAEGTNGTPSGFDNNCEDEIECEHEFVQYPPVEKVCVKCSWTESRPSMLVTKPECLHAESNAIAKIARSTNSSVGATLYCTLEPCFSCAKLIIQAGIVRVVFAESYVGPSGGGGGPELLQRAEIQVDKYDG